MKLLAQGIQLGTIGPKPSENPFAPDLTKKGVNAVTALPKFISTFIGFLTTLAGLMFLIYFIVAALSWITAGGEKGKIESARQQMTNAALGLIIVIASYAIVGIVGGVLGLNILNPLQVLDTLVPKP